MRNLIIIVVFSVIYALSTSCEGPFGNYLDKAPGVDVTLDTLFSSKSNVEMFLATCYDQGMPLEYPYNNRRIGTTSYSAHNDNNFPAWSASCDEAEMAQGWYFTQQWNSGGINVSNADAQDSQWPVRWNGIRNSYVMLENVGRVPDIDQTYKDQIKAEVKWLIASCYFEMLKRYGGVPLVNNVYQVGDDFSIQRSSVDTIVKFIVKNLDEAAVVLPDAWSPNWKGRVTKGAALALKAKTLLFAASPMFNTATPYMEMTNPVNNRLLCYGNYDVNRWKLAADAAKAVLDWAPAGGIQLITDRGADKNYKYAWEVLDNSEIILADKMTNGRNKGTAGNFPWAQMLPNPMGGWGGITVTHTFVENFYDKKDGTPQTWDNAGTDLNQKYAELDYRFAQTVGYNGSRWNNERPVLETFQPNGLHRNFCVTGYWMKKFIPDGQNFNYPQVPVNFPYLRLNEQYLIYAEALNEFNASPPQEAYDAINTIRARSGMPNLPPGLTKEEFRARVWKEWGVEFAFEDHRFWDIRRWMIAENTGVMQGPMEGLRITKFGTETPQQFQYERFVFENRTWKRYMYLNAFKTQEVNKGYLEQNPGF